MKNLLGAALLCSALTGCAGLNSDFDCNKTATDQCLTTGEANKLAAQGKSLDDLTAEKTAKKPAGETLPALNRNHRRQASDHCARENIRLTGHAAGHAESCDPRAG
ncbi:MAG: hypothetical protein E6974_01860 [Veillonella sp.]|nr:hypothetical protein [Veillonella sp.]